MNHDDRVSAADRKEQIIEKATMLFYTNGYDNTSIRELAKATGLSVAGVYYFFKDKEEILFSILIQSINDLNDTILSAINEKDDPKKNLKRIIRKLLSHNIKHKRDIIILNKEDDRLSAEQKQKIQQKRFDAYSLLKNELLKLEKTGELRAKHLTSAVFMMFSMTTWFVRWYNPNGPLSLEEIAEEITTIFFNGILN